MTAGPGRLVIWLGAAFCGVISALGIAEFRGVAGDYVSGADELAGLPLLFALAVGTAFQVAAFLLLRLLLRQGDPGRIGDVTMVGILAAGAVADAALNRVLVAEASPPYFGPVSIVLFCLPHVLAVELVTARSPWRWAVVPTVAVALGLGVQPIRAWQEHFAAHEWFAAHAGLDRRLVQAVSWPGGQQAALEVDSHGSQVTVFFPDSTVDGESSAVVTVSPPGADPCGDFQVVDAFGLREAEVDRCEPAGPGVWNVAASGFVGQVERRNGVLLRLSESASREGEGQDDLATVAASLHPLDDHELWPYLGSLPQWDWLVL